MARPTKFSPAVQQALVTAISMGASYKLAAQYAGISYETFSNWMQAGEDPALPDDHTIGDVPIQAFRDLAAAVRQAEGVAVVGWLAKIEKAANEGAWQAAAWKLERRYPQEYGRQSLELVGKDGEALPAAQTVIYLPQKLTDEIPEDAESPGEP